MRTYSSKAEFIRSLGVDCTNAQGQYSFVNHDKRRVYFGLDLANGDQTTLILGDAWEYHSVLKKNGELAKKPTYSKSIPHIKLITDNQYELYIFRTKTRQDSQGKVHATKEFDPNIEHRLLARLDDGWHALNYPSNGPIVIDLPEKDHYVDGGQQVVISTFYERDRNARRVCLNHHGYQCKICKFDFEKIYGERGKGFIHVHHITPLHTIKKKHAVNPTTDLIPVCPNCHAMLHAGGQVIMPDTLKSIIESHSI